MQAKHVNIVSCVSSFLFLAPSFPSYYCSKTAWQEHFCLVLATLIALQKINCQSGLNQSPREQGVRTGGGARKEEEMRGEERTDLIMIMIIFTILSTQYNNTTTIPSIISIKLPKLSSHGYNVKQKKYNLIKILNLQLIFLSKQHPEVLTQGRPQDQSLACAEGIKLCFTGKRAKRISLHYQ